MPFDRLFYQFIADNCVTIIDAKTDNKRSFSHKIDRENPDNLFLSTRECWSEFQAAMRRYANESGVNYILKIDVANFFGSINQHFLVNNLADSGLKKGIAERLEILLTSLTNSRSSRGIIQGIFPSDMLGNFYLEPFDRFLADCNVTSARYVDDIYVFLDSVDAADRLIKDAIPKLRELDLTLNEAKSALFPKTNLIVEEPDLELLFQNAIEEIKEQLQGRSFEVPYGFQAEWDDVEDEDGVDDEDEDDNIEVQATTKLFDAIENYPGHEEEIERFCLPLFIKTGSDHAIEHVISAFDKRPSMCQIYCTYLGSFLNEERVESFLIEKVKDTSRLYDWQLMWIIGALLQKKKSTDEVVGRVHKIFQDGQKHDAVRAVAAIFVGTCGDLVRRRALIADCPKVTEYVQAAIYFISKRWRDADGANMQAQWGNRLELNQLINVAWENARKKEKAKKA